MIIKLNEAEQSLAKHIASRRFNNARSNNVANQKIGPQSDKTTDLEGIGSEIAYCKMMNIYPDLETEYCLPDYDAVTRDGERIDVKATKYKNGHLLATLKKKNNPPDFYVLLVGSFPEYIVVGYMPAEILLRKEQIKNLGRGPGYAAEQSELRFIEEWKQ